MATSTPQATVDRVLALTASQPDLKHQQIADATGVSHDTVTRLLARQQPVVSLLRASKRDELFAGWQWLALDTLAALQDDPELKMRDRQSGAITLGICTEKLLLLSGQPTQITANINETRVSLHDVASRLSGIARRLTTSSGPAIIEAETVVQPSEKTGEGR